MWPERNGIFLGQRFHHMTRLRLTKIAPFIIRFYFDGSNRFSLSFLPSYEAVMDSQVFSNSSRWIYFCWNCLSATFVAIHHNRIISLTIFFLPETEAAHQYFPLTHDFPSFYQVSQKLPLADLSHFPWCIAMTGPPSCFIEKKLFVLQLY